MNKRVLALCSIVALVLIFPTGLISIAQNRIDYERMTRFSAEQLDHTLMASPTDAIWGILGHVNRDRALSDLRRLTGEEPICVSTGCHTIANRLTGSEGLGWAMDYIAENLVSLGYSVELRNWSRSGRSGQNLIARKSGVFSPTEEIYLVAHVDGVKPSGEERSPAADDNASGAVGVLEAARALSTFSFSRTVVLLFTTGEEQGALGAYSYLDQLSSEQIASITYAVNVDMVGYDADRDQVIELWSGDHLPSLALTQVMSETINAFQLDLAPEFVVGCD